MFIDLSGIVPYTVNMETKVLTYTLEIEKHANGYLAHFPALQGCQTWGDTYEAAVERAQEAIIGYIEALQINGEGIPVEHSVPAPVSLGIRVDVPMSV